MDASEEPPDPVLDHLIAEEPFTISIEVRRDPEDSPPGRSEAFRATAAIRLGESEPYPSTEIRTADPAGAYAGAAAAVGAWLVDMCQRARKLQILGDDESNSDEDA